MASARLRRRDKKLESLVKENARLHEDVKELEEAYQLHRHQVDQDRNSVHGLIRNEIGGSRWAHGGSGKLTTYKSSKDLIDDDGARINSKQRPNTDREGLTNRMAIDSDDNRRVRLADELRNNNMTKETNESDGNQNKILDLKTRVLKKASSKIIRRDTWTGPADTNGDVSYKKPKVSDREKTDYKTVVKSKKKDIAKPIVPNEKLITDKKNISRKQENVSISSENRQHKEDKHVRRSRFDIHESNKKSGPSQITDTVLNDMYDGDSDMKSKAGADVESLVIENNIKNVLNCNSSDTKYSLNAENNKTFTKQTNMAVSGSNSSFHQDNTHSAGLPSLSETTDKATLPHTRDSTDRSPEKVNGPPISNIFQTETVEPTEIYIDTENGQIRVKPGDESSLPSLSNLEATKVLIQQGTVHKSMDGQKLPCSVIEHSHSGNTQQEVRDIFGLGELGTHVTGTSHSQQRSYGTSVSPFALVRECNTEVEFWLHRLGLPDVEKYVKIFSDHEIDLLDLEFMTASQLHDMGITAIGALDKILKGVKDLRSGSKSKTANSMNLNESQTNKQLQLSSIAWEVEDGAEKVNEGVRKSVEKDLKRQSLGRSVNGNTFVQRSREISNPSTDEINDLRMSSARSIPILSDCGDSLSSTRSKVSSTTPSFTASTKASSLKCVDKRPPSSKTATQNRNKVKRSDSNVSDKSAFKLSQMEGKPTRSVLIRQRSSSLTREVTPKQQPKVEKEEKPVRGRSLRYRSRSADAVKRKALKGVQTAAKKFEEKQQRDKDSRNILYHRDDRMKVRRDEMAARHLQRERHREIQSSDSEEEPSTARESNPTDNEEGRSSLVTVNILPQSGPGKSPTKSDGAIASGDKSNVRKSLRRVEPARRQGQQKSLARPVDLQFNSSKVPAIGTPTKGIKSYQEKSPRSQSEPESGYKTDGTTSFSHVEGRVNEIQKKIKRLKSRASTGDELTGTLVKDLQAQLQQFEQILGTRQNRSAREPTSDDDRNQSDFSINSGRMPKSDSDLRRSASFEVRRPSPVEGLQLEDQTTHRCNRVGRGDDEVVRMSKRELLDEMRKEKKNHHLQIRQLQKELERIRHADPVTTMEIQQSDILYTDEDVIGEGAFSQVFKGLYQGSEVAVKRLKVPLRSQDRNYFNAELSLLKELRHPRVVLLIGVCTSNKIPVMVLEYMSKGSLYNYLHDPVNESLDHALYFQVARDITAGMKYLHSHRPEVIHLDLKSMNVLLCQSFRAKIADFGFSKLRHDAGIKSKPQTKQTNVSSPAWMSPELLNKGEVTTKTDVYSFAVILWEMLTRKEPYQNLTVFKILERVRKNKRPELPVKAPDGLQLLISQCWDPNPAKRPQFKDILQLLENLEFPPAWRELFKKAGVPVEALSNVQSTRNIIQLVTNTLELPGPPNFMLTVTPRIKAESLTPKTPKEDLAAKILSGAGMKSSRDLVEKTDTSTGGVSRLDFPREITSERDRWESETVTTLSGGELSDESDVTLRGLKGNASDDIISSSDDERSVTSSDLPSTVIAANTHKVQKRPVNVFIPSLELSIESARKEFSAERDRISRSSWLSISIDDRTYRSEEENQAGTENNNKNVNSETSLNLLSNRSSESSTPSAVALTESNQLNESARSRRRRNRAMDVESVDSSEEFSMRESFNNRRPNSAKKRVSLTKKLMDKSARSDTDSARSDVSELRSSVNTCSDNTGMGTTTNMESNGLTSNESISDNLLQTKSGDKSDRSVRLLGNVDSSYDSFFGLPVQRTSVPKVPSKPHGDKGTVSDSRVLQLSTDTGISDLSEYAGTDRKRNAVRRSDLYLVDSEPDAMSTDRSQNKDVVDEVKKYIEGKTRLSHSQSLDTNTEPSKADLTYSNKGTDDNKCLSVNNSVESSSQVDVLQKSVDTNVSYVDKSLEVCQSPKVIKGTEKTKKSVNAEYCHRNSMRSDTLEELRNSGLFKNAECVTRYSCLNGPETSKRINSVNENERKKQNIEQFKSEQLENQAAFIRHSLDTRSTKQHTVQSDRANTRTNTDTRLSLNLSNMNSDRQESVLKSRELTDVSERKQVEDVVKSTDLLHDSGEQIRVVLNPKEVQEKKKPAITPRKSKMKVLNAKVPNTEPGETNTQSSIDNRISNLKESNVNVIKNDSSKINSKNDSTKINSRSDHKDNVTTNANIKSRENQVKTSTERPKMAGHRKQVSPRPMKPEEKVSKSGKIRVKIRKDPLAPKPIQECPASPVPPPPPPPPILNLSASMSTLSKSMLVEAPRLSMADELKSRINQRQSISEGMKIVRKNTGNTSKPVKPGNIIGTSQSDEMDESETCDDLLVPQQSDGLPSFVVQSMELRDQKGHLRSISKPHRQQIDDLSGASQEQLSSIADILRKAVMGRRLAMGEGGDNSVSQSLDSVATGWSVDFT